MAFNAQTFRTRTITAIIFAAVMLAGLLWNQWSFFILFSVIHFGCWGEYQELVGLIDPGYKKITAFHKYGVMLAGWCIMLWFTGDSYKIAGLHLHEFGWLLGIAMLFLLPIVELLATRHILLKNFAHSFFGLVYISLSWGLMMDLYKNIDIRLNDTFYVVEGKFIPLLIIVAIWINDTMAYIVGSFIGKTPFSKISPKKTWEGTLGGIILSIATIGLVSYFGFRLKGLTYHIIFVTIIATVAGTFGDLLESKLKRMAGVKDSGSLMPGHGGFLDRFDSLLLATPFVWLYVKLFLH